MAEKTLSKKVIVSNPQGLHARPAHAIVTLVGKFHADIEFMRNGECVDGKSILSILTLGAEKGAELTIRASGKDAGPAIDALVELFESGFAEEGEEVPEFESPADG